MTNEKENAEQHELKDAAIANGMEPWPSMRFRFGDRVRKMRGSQWQGKVCGWYSTAGTPIGWCVESEREIGSVQVWPDAALERCSER